MTIRRPIRTDGPTDEQLRQALLVAASCVTGFGFLHHLDHIIRGNYVGWPLIADITPFTFALLLYPLLLSAIYFTLRDRIWAGAWVGIAIPILLLAILAHFLPLPSAESLTDISIPYKDPLYYVQASAPANRIAFFRDVYAKVASPFWAFLAIAILFSWLTSCAGLLITALYVRFVSGRW